MSDIDPDLPDYLVDAILSEAPPADAVDLVKSAFTWRTIDAELMELSYDSVLDEAGVRDASARRTLEFSVAGVSLVIEVDGLRIMGAVSPLAGGTVSQIRGAEVVASAPVDGGRFDLLIAEAGAVQLRIELDDLTLDVPAFVAG